MDSYKFIDSYVIAMYCFLFNNSHIIFYFIESVFISWATVVGLASGVLLRRTVYTDFTQTYQIKSNFLVALYQSWNSKIVPSAMEPIVTVTNTWKPCSKDIQFRQSKDLGSASNIRSNVKLLRDIITLTSVFNCLTYPTTTSFLLSFILVIFVKKWLLRRISFRLSWGT